MKKTRCDQCVEHELVWVELAPVVVYCRKYQKNRAAGAFCIEEDKDV